jgi:hypothetical protein
LLVDGMGNLTVVAGHGGALVEESCGSAGAHQRVSCSELSGMNSAAPQGCSGTCPKGRKGVACGRRHAPPKWEAGDDGGALTSEKLNVP